MAHQIFILLGGFAFGVEVIRAIGGIISMLREADMHTRVGGFLGVLIYGACAVGIWGLLPW